MAQEFTALTQSDLERLDRQRDWVRGHFVKLPEENYAKRDEKLRLIHVILENGWVEKSETWKLQSLGVAFGDALAQELNLAWMIVDDEFGRDATLKDISSALNINPITMISKRVERGETIDIEAMFKGVCDQVREIRLRQYEAGERQQPA